MSQPPLDAYERPPEGIRQIFKKYQKVSLAEVPLNSTIIQSSSAWAEISESSCRGLLVDSIAQKVTCEEFLPLGVLHHIEEEAKPVRIFEMANIPGLYILLNLLSPQIQLGLLERLFHRDLSNKQHLTNVHLHYRVSYPQAGNLGVDGSFFGQDPAQSFEPKDPRNHKQINVRQFLEKKLRWMTLGGQYDWTAKRYPSAEPPPFPADIERLIRGLFPAMDPQAAIVNVYSPGDTLSVHRDVSEECDRGLVSISIGCDGIFVVGSQDDTEHAVIRLGSGDVVYMTGPSRHAWHGVPKIVAGTCPEWLAKWPSIDGATEYKDWLNWMENKRINFNVRQMHDNP